MARHDQAQLQRALPTPRKGLPRGVPFVCIAALACGACGPGDNHSGRDAAHTDGASQDVASDGAARDVIADLATDVTTGDTVVPFDGSTTAPEVLLPRTGLTASELAVLVNDDDPLSVSVAAAYVAARHIPSANVVHLHVGPATAVSLTQAAFMPLKTAVDAALAPTIQAMLITWTRPYRVDNMSITSAFALGYRTIANTCTDPNAQSGTLSPYVLHPTTTQPFTDASVRLAMTLPATTLAEAQAIIDHGVASDDTWPTGTAYLMDTHDQTRSARCIVNATFGYTNECQTFLNGWDTAGSGVNGSIVHADEVDHRTDVLFYVQGLASVAMLATNTYLPGAVGDHLTSYGGQIPTSGQMSAFEFLRAGTTGSYGTVVEPCAYTEKFPDPAVLIPAYFGGNTLIEAYWRSVQWPAEGIFLGEPLARPWGTGFHTSFANGTLTLTTTTMVPGHTYLIEAADSSAGPFTTVLPNLTVTHYTRSTFTIPNATRHTYRFRE